MSDIWSRDVETAAYLARELEEVDADRPSPAELVDESASRSRSRRDPYAGTCGGCGGRVSARSPGGSCLWRGGPWHPACREADREAGGTNREPPR